MKERPMQRHSIKIISAISLTTICLGIAPIADAADLSDLVGGDPVKVVGDCRFTEGPAWHPDGYLLFSDIPNNRIVRVNTDGSFSDWMTDSGGANGLMCDQSGNVYAAQGVAGRVSILKTGADGTAEEVRVLAITYDDKPFNKPNDLALDSQGGIYFTDPNYGRDPADQPVEGVYYISPDGQTSRVIDDLPRPNGILVTADGKSLLVANPNERQIRRYRIESPGKISGGQVLYTGDEEADGNGPDGMTLDEHGNVYATYKSLVVLTPDGERIGRQEIPEKPSNCAFGGDDNRTLFVTARTSLYSLPMKVAGTALQQVANADGGGSSEETQEIKARDIVLHVPKSWTSSPPSNNMRLAQFAIDAADGDAEGAELVIFPPFGGSVAQNVQRWIGQFAGEGRQLKLTQGTADQGKYVLVDVSGTYNKPDGPPFLRKTKPTPDYRMLAVLFSSKSGGNYSFKLTGPKKTVGGVTDQFRNSFGGDASKETPYEF